MKRGTWRDPEAGRAIATSPFKIGWDKAAALAAAAKERRALLDTTFEPVTASEAGSFIALLVAGRPRAFVNLVKIRTSPKHRIDWDRVRGRARSLAFFRGRPRLGSIRPRLHGLRGCVGTRLLRRLHRPDILIRHLRVSFHPRV